MNLKKKCKNKKRYSNHSLTLLIILYIQAHRAAISKLTTDYEAEKKGLIEGYEKRLQDQKNDYESQLQQAKENALASITALEIELSKSQKQAQSLNGKLGKLNKNLASIQSENAAANARAQQAERESAESRAAAHVPSGDGENHSQRVQELEIELDRSRKEIIRMNRNWEKRFSVLRYLIPFIYNAHIF